MTAITDMEVKGADGGAVSLDTWRGKVLLIVNTASKCGFTPQYEGLEELHGRYADRGFEVLAFPCNQFGAQEPGDAAEIARFCSLTYDVTFPVFAKIDVNGPKADPLFQRLKKDAPGVLGSQGIKWNFTKFLVDREGNAVRRYAPTVKPEALTADIEGVAVSCFVISAKAGMTEMWTTPSHAVPESAAPPHNGPMHAGVVPLRIFSSYTMLDGAIEPKDIAAQAAKLGFPAAALTDRNGLYAAMPFSDAARAKGVQPIIGAMLAVARPDMPEGAAPVLDWLALYAQDEAGYRALCALVSEAHLDRPIEQPAHVGFAALEGRTAGLLALTAGGEGAVARLLAEDQPDRAAAYLDRLQALFPERLYIELARRDDSVEERAEAALIDLAYARDLPLVATNPSCFAEAAFGDAHDAMLCIASSSYVDSEDRVRSCPHAWIKPAPVMAELFADLPEAIANTLVVAQRCAVAAPARKPILPTLAGDTAAEADLLRQDARMGLERRLARIAELRGHPSRQGRGTGSR